MSTEPIFAALGDPFRRKVLENLAENSPKTATQLAELYPLTRQGILKHLNVLEDAGLVEVQQQGREKRYFLTPAPLPLGAERLRSPVVLRGHRSRLEDLDLERDLHQIAHQPAAALQRHVPLQAEVLAAEG